jgi:hypothetical protein
VARITCYALQKKERARSIQQPLEATHHCCHLASKRFKGALLLKQCGTKTE